MFDYDLLQFLNDGNKLSAKLGVLFLVIVIDNKPVCLRKQHRSISISPYANDHYQIYLFVIHVSSTDFLTKGTSAVNM